MSIDIHTVSVHFGGVKALTNVSFCVEPGRVNAVVGPNGSGKSTLFNSVSGLVPLGGGRISIDGVDLSAMKPYERVGAGVARTFQTPRFDPAELVERAVLCGFYPKARAGVLATALRLPSSIGEERELRGRCSQLLGSLGLLRLRDAPLGELSMGQLRLVEVARAIANMPRYLLLDEPAAGLSRAEQHLLAAEVRRVAASGVGVLLVEHNFSLIRELSDRVLVLDRGTPILEGLPHEIEANADFVSLYLGTGGKKAVTI